MFFLPIFYCGEVVKFQFEIRPCCISSCDEEDSAAGDGDDAGEGDDDVGDDTGDGDGGGDDHGMMMVIMARVK